MRKLSKKMIKESLLDMSEVTIARKMFQSDDGLKIQKDALADLLAHVSLFGRAERSDQVELLKRWGEVWDGTEYRVSYDLVTPWAAMARFMLNLFEECIRLDVSL